MKVLAILVLLCALPTVVSAADLSFPDAAKRMLEQNPSLIQKRLEAEAAQQQAGSARAAYLPQIDFVQSWSRSNNPVYVFGTLLNQQRFTEANFAIDSLNNPDPLSDHSSKFQLGWLLFDFGRRENQIQSANSAHRIASLQEAGARIGMLQELVRRYYAVSLAHERLAVAEEAVRSADSRLQQARERVNQGLAVASDQLTVEVFHARRLQERIEASNQKKLALAALLELLGSSSDEEIETSPLLDREPEVPEYSWWEIQMQENRPELKVVMESARLAHSQVRIRQSSFLPSLQGWSNYEWHGSSLSYSGDNWGVGVELKWNLFRGFSDAQQLSAAKRQELSAAEKQREVENAMKLQLKESYYRFQSAREKVRVAAVAVKQAEESRRIHSDRYAGGLVSVQDSLQAETAYNEARLMYSMNLYEMYVSYAALLAASGSEEKLIQIGVQ